MPSVGWWPTTSTGSRDSGQLAAASTAATVAPGASSGTRLEFALQRQRRLLRAIGRRNQDAAGVGQVRVEPRGHALRLLQPFDVRRRPRSGSPGSASQCRQRIRSIA